MNRNRDRDEEYIRHLEAEQAQDPDPVLNLVLEELYQERDQERESAVEKIRKGDQFCKGTSPTVYTATADETARGYVRAVAWEISVNAKVRFNSNEDALTIIKRAGK